MINSILLSEFPFPSNYGLTPFSVTHSLLINIAAYCAHIVCSDSPYSAAVVSGCLHVRFKYGAFSLELTRT